MKDENIVKANHNAMEELVVNSNMHGKYQNIKGSHFWHEVPVKFILNFINRFQNHPAAQLTEKVPLSHYVQLLQSGGMELWDLVLVSLQNPEPNDPEIGQLKVKMQVRNNVTDFPNPGSNGIYFAKHRVASRGIEKLGLTEEQIHQIEKEYAGKNIPDKKYREARKKPLLMLHLVDCRNDEISIFRSGAVAYGISFPGEAGSRRPDKTVEYVVNTVWWKNEYLDIIQEDVEYE